MTEKQKQKHEQAIERRARIVKLYRAGKTWKEISEEIGCGLVTIQRALDYMGAATRKSENKKLSIAILTDYVRLMPMKDIRKKYNIATDRIYDAVSWARKKGIRVPTQRTLKQKVQQTP